VDSTLRPPALKPDGVVAAVGAKRQRRGPGELAVDEHVAAARIQGLDAQLAVAAPVAKHVAAARQQGQDLVRVVRGVGLGDGLEREQSLGGRLGGGQVAALRVDAGQDEREVGHGAGGGRVAAERVEVPGGLLQDLVHLGHDALAASERRVLDGRIHRGLHLGHQLVRELTRVAPEARRVCRIHDPEPLVSQAGLDASGELLLPRLQVARADRQEQQPAIVRCLRFGSCAPAGSGEEHPERQESPSLHLLSAPPRIE